MSLWLTVLLACACAYLLKLAGFLVPERLVNGERTTRITTLLPVALLSALIATQAFVGEAGWLVLDARLAAVAVAVGLLVLRANFLIVVGAAAAAAALLRLAGWG